MLRFWLALLGTVVLAGCGGEREEPFDPGEPEEEFREQVDTRFLFDGRSENLDFPMTDTSGKRLEVIDNIEDFGVMLDAYDTLNTVLEYPDFEVGQVVLYDGGWIDNSLCEQQLVLGQRLEAHSIIEDETLVEVSLTYRRDPADESATCPNKILYRPYEIHYIETRADIVFVENVQGVSETTGGESSSD